MAELGMMTSSPATDFISMYTSKTCSPIFSLSGALSQLKFSPSPTKSTPDFHPDLNNAQEMQGLMGVSENFCNRETVAACVAHLNQEMTSLGMASLYDAKTRKFEVHRLVNATKELLQKHRRSMRVREELENKQHRNEADITHLHTVEDRLKEQLEKKERDFVQLQEKERQLQHKNKQLTGKLKAEKEEVKKLVSAIEHRDLQYKHEVKKKEREHAKLKERMHTLLASKADRKIALELVSSAPRSDGRRAKWMTPNIAHEEGLYQTTIGSYETRQKELMLENNEMRHCLTRMQKEFVALLHAPNKDTDKESLNSSTGCKRQDSSEGLLSDEEENSFSTQHKDLLDEHFQMPYELTRGGIEQSLQEKYKRLKRYIRQIEKQKVVGVAARLPAPATSSREDPSPRRKSTVDEGAYHKKEAEMLRKQLKKYTNIIEQQELLLQQYLQPADEDQADECVFMNDSELWREEEKLQRERELFQREKANFERERKNFTEAAVRLGREQKIFNEDKSMFLVQDFMNITPFRDARPKSAGSISRSRSKRLLPPTPSQLASHPSNKAPATSTPHGSTHPHNNPPSTADLYRKVGLIPPEEEHSQQHPVGHFNRIPILEETDPIGGSPSLPQHRDSEDSGSNSQPLSPVGTERHSQHINSIKQTLFRQHSAAEGAVESDIDSRDEEEDEEEEEQT